MRESTVMFHTRFHNFTLRSDMDLGLARFGRIE
jgi:hypothetical protein